MKFVSEFRLENYKVFRSQAVFPCGKINVIGGENASGKSSLLEAIFSVMDIQNPTSLVRPAYFRGFGGIDQNQGFILRTSFANIENPIDLRATTRDGVLSYRVEVVHDLQSSFSSTIFADTTKASSNLGSQTSFVSIASLNDASLSRSFMRGGEGILQIEHHVGQDYALPTSAFLTSVTMLMEADLTLRWSKIRARDDYKEIVNAFPRIGDKVKDFNVMNRNGYYCVNVIYDNERIVPLKLTGSGFQVYTAIAFGVIETAGGTLFIDEFDASIHYSRLEEIWDAILKLSLAHNSQLFIATHSLESIQACTRAATKLGILDELYYHRLSRVKQRGVTISTFRNREIQYALKSGVELR